MSWLGYQGEGCPTLPRMNGQGISLANPIQKEIQWYWMDSACYQGYSGSRNTSCAMAGGSQFETSTAASMTFVADPCEDSMCYLVIACKDWFAACPNITVQFHDGMFDELACAQDTPVTCASVPATGACMHQDNTTCSTCCVTGTQFVNTSAGMTCGGLRQDCPVLQVAPGFSPSPQPQPPRPTPSPGTSDPSGSQPATPASSDPTLLIYVGSGVALGTVAYIALLAARSRRARQEASRHTLPLIHHDYVSDR